MITPLYYAIFKTQAKTKAMAIIMALVAAVVSGEILAKDNQLSDSDPQANPQTDPDPNPNPDPDPNFTESYYEQTYLGERKTRLYVGPLSPDSFYNPETGEVEFLDEYWPNSFFFYPVSEPFKELTKFFIGPFASAQQCSNFFMGQHISYLRYLFRLLSISYIFEGMKQYHTTLYQLGLKNKTCRLNLEKILAPCRPQDQEFKKFIRRLTGYKVSLNAVELVKKSRIQRKKWRRLLQKKTTGPQTGLAQKRIGLWCKIHNVNCRRISFSSVEKALGQVCRDDELLIQNICSERDQLYGLSTIPLARQLIESSSAINVMRESGAELTCIKRFASLFSSRENVPFFFPMLFNSIFSKLNRDRDRDREQDRERYLQGELFLPGSLKEFDDKGLTDFLFRPLPVPPASPPKPLVIKRPPLPLPPPPPPLVKLKLAPKPLPPPPPPPKPMVRPSHFEWARQKIVQKKLKRITLKTDLLKKDFSFSPKMLKSFTLSLKDYQTYRALLDMKDNDNLGHRQEPLRLSFLRYLIDQKRHQTLYNILSVIGKNFYLVNDIEKKKEAVYTELSFNGKLHRWEITLLEDPTLSPEIKAKVKGVKRSKK